MKEAASADLFDLPRSVAARDAGIKQTVENNQTFSDGFRAHVRSLPVGWVGIAEELRRGWIGLPPKTPHAWGGVVQGLVRGGWLELTGVRRPMTDTKSHARRTDEYRRTSKP
jgi:hypothetical protein